MWPGGEGTENIRGRGWVGCGRYEGRKKKEKRKVDYYYFFLYSFSEPLKNAMPHFFLLHPKKRKSPFSDS